MSSKSYCPECGDPLGNLRFSIHASGFCINRTCNQFKQRREWKQNLCQFLDLIPYSKEQFLELPEDTPIWIEYRSDTLPLIAASDIYLCCIYGNANFAIANQLPLDTYGKQWRAWPTFKTFRPDQFDLEHHPW